MFEQASKEFGPLDILVNNAGIETIIPFLEMTDDKWTRLVDVNLRGPWMCSQVFCRHVLGAKRKGAIVNIGSVQAARSLPGRTHYAPTKLAMEALTRNVSTEVAHLPIGIGQPIDVAHAVVFLASPLAKMITGASIDICGTIRGIL
jgi:glucose 1-dehydrogenase/3-oxoacyl-[acyl-carrier protein] reductase